MKQLPLILFFVFQVSFGQHVPTTLVAKIPLDAEKYVGTDNYGNIYFINNNILYKKGRDKIYQFSDLQLGKLDGVDIINPLKITLFYPDMNTVVFVDRHLIDINRIRFNRLSNLRTLGFASTASNNNLWIMNVGSQSLEIYNYLTNTAVADSQPISSEIVGYNSNFNFCWLLLENSLERYNSYGTLVQRIPEVSFIAITENNGRVVGKTDEGFFLLKKDAKTFIPIDLPKLDVQQFYLNDEQLYLYDGEFIYTYKLN